MDETQTLHYDAMYLADLADQEKRAGNLERAKELYADAIDREREAARTLQTCYDLEPTRSVLFRSAAVLALECGELTTARVMANDGLTDNTPCEIAAELRELLEQAHFKPNDRVRQKFHPEWGEGIIRSVGKGGGMIVADWQHHFQQVPLPAGCLEKVTIERAGARKELRQ